MDDDNTLISEDSPIPHGDHDQIVEWARGIVTGELMVADLENQAWQASLALLMTTLVQIPNVGLIVVPKGPHLSMPWINNTAPGCTVQCQMIAREDIEAVNQECERMYQALHPTQES